MTPDAFAHAALSMRRQLVLRATQFTHDVDEAADLVDGVIAGAYRRCRSIQPDALTSYLQRGLTNAIRTWYRRPRVRSGVSLDALQSVGWQAASPASGASAEHEAAEDLARAIGRLPPHYRDAIVRTYWRDQKQGAGKMTVCRARQMLSRDPDLQRYAGRAA